VEIEKVKMKKAEKKKEKEGIKRWS